jgi:dihydrofolate reductase
MISMIASSGKNREIGRENGLIWRFHADMKFFRQTTMGHLIIMGRSTFQSLPGLLPGRGHAVLTKNKDFSAPGITVYHDAADLISRYGSSEDEAIVIGGAQIYKLFMPYAMQLYITEIDDTCPGADAFFPDFDKKDFEEYEISRFNEENIDCIIKNYIRKSR